MKKTMPGKKNSKKASIKKKEAKNSKFKKRISPRLIRKSVRINSKPEKLKKKQNLYPKYMSDSAKKRRNEKILKSCLKV